MSDSLMFFHRGGWNIVGIQFRSVIKVNPQDSVKYIHICKYMHTQNIQKHVHTTYTYTHTSIDINVFYIDFWEVELNFQSKIEKLQQRKAFLL